MRRAERIAIYDTPGSPLYNTARIALYCQHRLPGLSSGLIVSAGEDAVAMGYRLGSSPTNQKPLPLRVVVQEATIPSKIEPV